MSLHSLALLVALSACASACAGRFNEGIFKKGGIAYRVGPLDASFQRVQIEDYDLAFYKPGAGTISANAMCKDYDDVPHEALLNHLLFGTTRRSFLQDEEVTIDGRAARHARVNAELDGVPVQLEIYLLTRAGCVFDLSYVSSREAPARAEFGRFVAAFHIESIRL